MIREYKEAYITKYKAQLAGDFSAARRATSKISQLKKQLLASGWYDQEDLDQTQQEAELEAIRAAK